MNSYILQETVKLKCSFPRGIDREQSIKIGRCMLI